MAQVLSDVLGRNVAFRQLTLADVESALIQRGASEGVVRDVTEATTAANGGIYDAGQAASAPGQTDFRTWCLEVLQPTVLA